MTIRHLKLVGAGTDEGIQVNAGSDNIIIEDVEVSGWFNGILLDGAKGNVVRDSNTHDNDNLGIIAQGGGKNIIQRNVSQANGTGIGLEDEDEDLVADNVLSGNTLRQIILDADAAIINARVVRNQITSASDGIFIDEITSANSLIVIGGRPEDANTFSGTFNPGAGNYYVELSCASENTVDATYNWWGSILRTDIANRIFNDEDDPGGASGECSVAADHVTGAVVFPPWATGPAPTPTPSPTPSPTATPTATGTPTPTATPPGATRTINLSPAGWHDLAWSGADATDPGTALACISGDYSIAYAWEGPTAGVKRYVEGCAIPGICNMAALNKYDTLLVSISAAGVTCVMPVAP